MSKVFKTPKARIEPRPEQEPPIEMPTQDEPKFRAAARQNQRQEQRRRRGRDASDLSSGGPRYSRTRLG